MQNNRTTTATTIFWLTKCAKSEVMRMFKNGQFKHWVEAVGSGTEAAFVNRLFASMLENRTRDG